MELKIYERHFSSFYVLSNIILTLTKATASLENCFGCDGILLLETDGPAVLDAQISVKAEIKNAKDYEGPFYFSFSKLRNSILRLYYSLTYIISQ